MLERLAGHATGGRVVGDALMESGLWPSGSVQSVEGVEFLTLRVDLHRQNDLAMAWDGWSLDQ